MKKIRSEHIKHRLIGLTVALSLMIIFLPAMMKHSNQRFDELSTYRVPKKPALPRVAVINKKAAFQAVKVATVDIPHVTPVSSKIARAQPISVPPTPMASSESRPVQQQKAGYREVFTIQLATFSKQDNAQLLVNQLRAKGFQAETQKIHNEQGPLFQVIVGQLKQHGDAVDLQKKLVNHTQLNGLIIKTKVS